MHVNQSHLILLLDPHLSAFCVEAINILREQLYYFCSIDRYSDVVIVAAVSEVASGWCDVHQIVILLIR